MDSNFKTVLAFDGSARTIDANGYMHVSACHITKESVDGYKGFEIPGYESLGLEPDKIYKAYRSSDELEKAVQTFNGLPLLLTHKADSAENPQKEMRVGSVGTSAVWNAPYIDNVLSVTDAEAIEAIKSGSYKELSSSYRYTPDFTAGVFEGEHYDFVMRDILGNHVALVQKGRAGADVCVADSAENILKPKTKRSIRMKSKRARALTRLAFAMDEDPNFEVIEENLEKALLAVNKIEDANSAKDEDKDAVIEKVIEEHFKNADESTLKTIRTTLQDLAYGKATGDEDDKKEKEAEKKPALDEDKKSAMDKVGCDSEDPAEQKAFAEGVKYAENMGKKDEKPAKKTPEKTETNSAQDAAMIESNVRDKVKLLYDAANRCKPLIGNIENPFAFDSAEEIYGKALQLSGVKTAGYPKTAYRGMVDILLSAGKDKKSAVAFDSDPEELDERFKHLSKISVDRS